MYAADRNSMIPLLRQPQWEMASQLMDLQKYLCRVGKFIAKGRSSCRIYHNPNKCLYSRFNGYAILNTAFFLAT